MIVNKISKYLCVIIILFVIALLPVIIGALAINAMLASNMNSVQVPNANYQGLPLACESYVVTSNYIDEEYYAMMGNYHYAIDMVGFIGDDKKNVPVISLFDGIVDSVSTNVDNGYGVVIYSPNNQLYIMYWHFRDKPSLNVGDVIKKGDILGIQGTTGKSTGIHLHIQVFNDKERKNTIDPRTIMPNLGEKGERVKLEEKSEKENE